VPSPCLSDFWRDRAGIFHSKGRLKAELTEIALGSEAALADWINTLEPEMTKARRKELIKQFRDAAYEKQQRGLRRH